MIEIIEFKDSYADQFRKLNMEWLYKYDVMEDYDLAVINNPKKMILDTGGCIYLARDQEEIVGTAGLVNEGDHVFELVKMAVAPAYQGRGISKLLLERCLQKANEMHAKKVFLYSNSRLHAAISLYKKYGFVHIDASNSPLLTADVKMELVL